MGMRTMLSSTLTTGVPYTSATRADAKESEKRNVMSERQYMAEGAVGRGVGLHT